MILPVMLRSRRKFCPRAFLASNPCASTVARSEGSIFIFSSRLRLILHSDLYNRRLTQFLQMAGGDFFHAALFKEFFDVFLSRGFGFIAFGVEYLVKLEDIVILSDFDLDQKLRLGFSLPRAFLSGVIRRSRLIQPRLPPLEELGASENCMA